MNDNDDKAHKGVQHKKFYDDTSYVIGKKVDGKFVRDPKAKQPNHYLLPPDGVALEPGERELIVEVHGEKVLREWEQRQRDIAAQMIEAGELTPEQERWAFATLGWGEPEPE